MRDIVVPTFLSLSQPIASTLRQIAEAGLRLVEIHGDAPDTHIDLTDEAAVNALARVVSGLPLAVHSVHCAFSQPSEEAWDISEPDDEKRASALRNRAAVIRASVRLGAHHVVVHPGVRHRGEGRLAHSRASLAHLDEVARAAGAVIAVENLPPDHLASSLTEMQWLLEDLDPTVVGFCLDTGHAMLGEEPLADYVRGMGDRLLGIHWHANDCSDDAHLFPDPDRPEWSGFFAALDEVGYNLPVTVEAVPPATKPLREALRSVHGALRGEHTPRPA